jgi:biotin operon repressor
LGLPFLVIVSHNLVSPLLPESAQGGNHDHTMRACGLSQDQWHKIKEARQRLVLCRLMIDIMRTLHGTYAPVSEPFGTRLETFFVGLCVAIGDIDGKPFSVAKIAAYMRVPRTTVIRRLDRLQSWGLIDRRGRHYYMHEKMLNSLIGMRSYQQVRRFLSKATEELSVLDTLLD